MSGLRALDYYTVNAALPMTTAEDITESSVLSTSTGDHVSFHPPMNQTKRLNTRINKNKRNRLPFGPALVVTRYTWAPFEIWSANTRSSTRPENKKCNYAILRTVAESSRALGWSSSLLTGEAPLVGPGTVASFESTPRTQPRCPGI